ncbi:MAG TPA: glycine zipper 2TM domain-containing protein [Solimonas sp.]|nr:glycine zipper 2TM domain-containing protein [Solimonas sp.]
MKMTAALAAAIGFAALAGCATSDPAPTTGTVYPASSSTYPSSTYPNNSYPNSYPTYNAYEKCTDCGTVQSVTTREMAGKPNYVGAAVGAIIGGVAGHQVGQGRGNDLATAGGAVAGAAVGSQYGKDRSTVYDMVIRMDYGDTRTLTVASTEGLSTGRRVRVTGDHVQPL